MFENVNMMSFKVAFQIERYDVSLAPQILLFSATTVKSSWFSVSIMLSRNQRMGSAFIFLLWFELAHITFNYSKYSKQWR